MAKQKHFSFAILINMLYLWSVKYGLYGIGRTKKGKKSLA